MKERFMFAFLLVGVIVEPLWGGWERKWVESFLGTPIYAIAIGDARNDGKSRIYAWVQYQGLVELEYLPSGDWVYHTIYAPIESAIVNHQDGQGNINYGVIIGQGRNDGINRIYLTHFSGNMRDSLYEFTYSNGEWVKNVYEVPLGRISCVIAQARNDDTFRVYCCGDKTDNIIYELTWRNGSWDRNEIITYGRSLSGAGLPMITAGDGRNDGIIRLYVGTRFEITYKRGEWITDSITDTIVPGGEPFTAYWPFIIAKGRNDGLNRLYGCSLRTEPSGISYTESTFLNGEWVNEQIIWISGDGPLAIGNGRNDDSIRLYTGGVRDGDSLYEYTYIPDKGWSGRGCAKLEYNEGFIDIYIGKGRGDDTNRIYGVIMCDYLWFLVEFSYTSKGIEKNYDRSQRVINKLWISPNPSFGSFKIHYSVPKGYTTLRIYDASGRLIRNLVEGYKETGEYSICWDGKNEKGRGVINGVYFCELKNGIHSISKKIVYLKYKEVR